MRSLYIRINVVKYLYDKNYRGLTFVDLTIVYLINTNVSMSSYDMSLFLLT